MIVLSITLFLAGLLTTGLCLPMVYKKFPRNLFYGMRTRHTFQSDDAWRHLNEIGGMLFSLLGFPMMLGGSIGFFLEEQYVSVLGTATAVFTLITTGFAVYLFVRYSVQYSERNTPGLEQEQAR